MVMCLPRKKFHSKNHNYLHMLIQRKYGLRIDIDKHTFNLSNYILSETDK